MGDKQLRFTDDQRRRLAAKAKGLGRKALVELATIVTPKTLLAWQRRLIAQKYDGSKKQDPGRPRKAEEIEALVMPYGYRKYGEKGEGRRPIRKDPIPGVNISGDCRISYRMCATEKKSCQKIADTLTGIRVPCKSDWRSNGAVSGKRNRHVASIWHPHMSDT